MAIGFQKFLYLNFSLPKDVPRTYFTPLANSPSYPFVDTPLLMGSWDNSFGNFTVHSPTAPSFGPPKGPQSAAVLLDHYLKGHIQRRAGVKGSWKLQCLTCSIWVNTGINVDSIPSRICFLHSHSTSYSTAHNFFPNPSDGKPGWVG
ncbi:hypothetical protein B0H14DRAFT_2625138 [Mycena olivaceomarginata]|nr:hypothetical protein B0H14DRAFT_2625138 [Mycena olivaceomarginata]